MHPVVRTPRQRRAPSVARGRDRSSSGLEALDLPRSRIVQATVTHAGPAEAVVQPVGPPRPRLELVDDDPPTAPVPRARHLLPFEALLDLGPGPLQRLTTVDRL